MTSRLKTATKPRRPRKPKPYSPGWTDRTSLLRIGDSAETIRRAQAEQLEAVRAARADGIPWSWIAEALGVSRQSAHERFAEKVAESGYDNPKLH